MSVPQPLPGLKIKPPLQPKGANEELLGYSQCEPEVGCCKCDSLTSGGITAVVLLALFFPAGSCIPCCMESCHEPFQRPNFGHKAAGGGTTAGFPVDGTTAGTKDTHGYTQPSTTTTGTAGNAGYAGNTGSTGYSTQPTNTQGYSEGAGYPNLSSREATTNQGYVEMGGKQL